MIENKSARQVRSVTANKILLSPALKEKYGFDQDVSFDEIEKNINVWLVKGFIEHEEGRFRVIEWVVQIKNFPLETRLLSNSTTKRHASNFGDIKFTKDDIGKVFDVTPVEFNIIDDGNGFFRTISIENKFPINFVYNIDEKEGECLIEHK